MFSTLCPKEAALDVPGVQIVPTQLKTYLLFHFKKDLQMPTRTNSFKVLNGKSTRVGHSYHDMSL